MYRYDEFDAAFVAERVAQFGDQVARRLSGELSEDEFRPIRLKNGLYLQLHAYMLRVAIPYGTFSARQMRQLALIADRFDRGYGHFTTRQNIQYNWPRLVDAPAILAALAEVEMHAIQTSGNCIRNVTADPFAGVAAEEIADPRPLAELIRQWSSGHPEFCQLPRKFKIAVTGSRFDRAVIEAHDIGIRIVRDANGRQGYAIYVGGGLGRTPMPGRCVRSFLPQDEVLAYLEAIMRVYNAEGRRDNKYKARIKILVHETGEAEFARRVEAEYVASDRIRVNADAGEVARIAAYFAPPAYAELADRSPALEQARAEDAGFDRFVATNVFPHKRPGYAIVTVSLKSVGGIPGDASADQMRALADCAERWSLDELRVTHAQNIVLPHVRKDDLPVLWRALVAAGLATANAGLITDIIACPGLDYCTLATARSIPIAQSIAERFADPQLQADIGPLGLKISGCINACGHHHVGHIGILGLEKSGRENYQITLGGDPGGDWAGVGGRDADGENAAVAAGETARRMTVGERLGPGLDAEQVPGAVAALVDLYRAERTPGEPFIATVRRIGAEPFRARFAEFVAEGGAQ